MAFPGSILSKVIALAVRTPRPVSAAIRPNAAKRSALSGRSLPSAAPIGVAGKREQVRRIENNRPS